MDDLPTIKVGRVPNDGTGDPPFLAVDGTLAAGPPTPSGNASCRRQRIGTPDEDGRMIIRLGFADPVSGSDAPVVIAGVPSDQTAFHAVIGDLFGDGPSLGPPGPPTAPARRQAGIGTVTRPASR